MHQTSPSPTVSVILATYNRAHTVRRAIDSVLAQTYSAFELIVVDDGSTDDTAEIARLCAGDPRVRWLTRPHRGCAAARNAGVATARGRYVAFHDSDDVWLPHKLATAVAALGQAPPNVAVFYSDMLWITPTGDVPFESPDVTRGVLIDAKTLDFAVYKIGLQSAVVRRECLERAGPFDETLPRLIDLDLFIRLSLAYDFVHHREALVKFQAGGGISTDAAALLQARCRLLEKYRPQLKCPEHVAMQHALRAAAAIECGDRRAAAHAIEAVGRLPRHPAVDRVARSVLDALADVDVATCGD